MAVTSQASGSQAATLNTDHSLATVQVAGIFQLWVDASALANGETLILTAKVETKDLEVARQAFQVTFKHAQGDPVLFSPPIPVVANESLEFVLRQEGGTGRTYAWEVRRLDG